MSFQGRRSNWRRLRPRIHNSLSSYRRPRRYAISTNSTWKSVTRRRRGCARRSSLCRLCWRPTSQRWWTRKRRTRGWRHGYIIRPTFKWTTFQRQASSMARSWWSKEWSTGRNRVRYPDPVSSALQCWMLRAPRRCWKKASINADGAESGEQAISGNSPMRSIISSMIPTSKKGRRWTESSSERKIRPLPEYRMKVVTEGKTDLLGTRILKSLKKNLK